MKKFILILILILSANCTLNKVISHHGVPFLEDKNKKLITNKTNLNDISQLLGSPSTKSTFDNNVLIFIERKSSSSKLRKLGKKDLLINNVLILEVNSLTAIASKTTPNTDDIQKIQFVKSTTSNDYSRKYNYKYIYRLRKKINDKSVRRELKIINF